MSKKRRAHTPKKHTSGAAYNLPADSNHKKTTTTKSLLVGAGLIVALIVIAAATYANSLSGQFVFDDKSAIVDNFHLPHWNQFINVIATKLDSPVKGRPLVALSLFLNYAIGGLDTLGYHIFNIAVHICCTIVLFALVRRTLQSAPLKQKFDRAAGGLAFACALLWSVHPIQTDAVTYIIQRTEVMMALFYLLTLYCAARSFNCEKRSLWYTAAIVCCAAGMTCKEVMVTAPVMVLLYDRTFEASSFGSALRKRWPLYTGLAATWAVLAALMLAFPRLRTVGTSAVTDSVNYALNQCIMITRYLKLAFWPSPLLLDYGWPRSLTITRVLPQAIVIITLLALTIAALIYRPKLGFGGAWWFLILAPTSSFMPIHSEVGAERRMYLPLAAVVTLVVTVGYIALGRACKILRPKNPSILRILSGTTVVILIAGIFVSLTVRRNQDYHDESSIWQKSIEVMPDNARAYNNLGLLQAKKGRLDEAAANFLRATQLREDYAKANKNLGVIKSMQGKSDEAAEFLRRAIQIHPQYVGAYKTLGKLLHQQGKFDEALDNFQKAWELGPPSAEIHAYLGGVFRSMGSIDKALAHYREAIELEPDNTMALNDAAVILSGYPDPNFRDLQTAIILAERAASLTNYNNHTILATLAGCYATAGRFEQALQATQKAIPLAASAKDKLLLQDLKEQAKLFKQKLQQTN